MYELTGDLRRVYTTKPYLHRCQNGHDFFLYTREMVKLACEVVQLRIKEIVRTVGPPTIPLDLCKLFKATARRRSKVFPKLEKLVWSVKLNSSP